MCLNYLNVSIETGTDKQHFKVLAVVGGANLN